MRFSIQTARRSSLCSFPCRIVLVNYHQIGTSEQIRRPEVVEEVQTALLTNGYAGPPITVYQQGTDDLFWSVGNDTVLADLNYGDLGIADGHHRLEAIKKLSQTGQLRQKLMPVQLIPAHNHDLIRLATLRVDETPLEIEVIEACFKNENQFIPTSSTTHFQTRLTDGQWVRLMQSRPDTLIKHRDMIQN